MGGMYQSFFCFTLFFLDEAIDTRIGRWHICTGIGAYIFIAVIDHLVSGDDHKDIPGSPAWPAPWAAQSVFAGKGSDKKQA
jgi:dihydroceramidase